MFLLTFEALEVKRDFDGRLINLKLPNMTGSFRSCVSMLRTTQGAGRNFFQAYGDTRFPGYLCFLEVISIVLIVSSQTKLGVTTT